MDILITKDIQNSWVFQDAEKLKWWLDLVLMADGNGEIHMSLSDLSHRWKAPKTTVHRFIAKLISGTINGTKTEHQSERITIHISEVYKGTRNAKWNESGTISGTPQESPLSSPSSSPSLSSPTPPSNTLSTIPPIIPQENSSSSSCVCTHAREDDFGLRVGVVATIERYAEQYRQEGMWTDVAIQNHLKVEQVQEIFKTFLFDQRHNSTAYSNYSDFKRHFLNYIRLRASAIKAEQSQHREEPRKVISGKDIFDIYK